MDRVEYTKHLMEQYHGRRIETRNRLEYLARMRMRDKQKGTAFAVDYAQQIEQTIRNNNRFFLQIESAVEKIADPVQREALKLRYMEAKDSRATKWKYVALALYGDNSDAYITAAKRMSNKALRSLAAILESEGANE